MKNVIVKIGTFGDSRFKSWAKLVTGVDTSKTNGYAFQGPFLPTGRLAELELGSIVLWYGEEGSRANHCASVLVRRLVGAEGEKGTWEDVEKVKSSSWALKIRDQVAAAVADTTWIDGAAAPTQHLTPAELKAELQKWIAAHSERLDRAEMSESDRMVLTVEIGAWSSVINLISRGKVQ